MIETYNKDCYMFVSFYNIFINGGKSMCISMNHSDAPAQLVNPLYSNVYTMFIGQIDGFEQIVNDCDFSEVSQFMWNFEDPSLNYKFPLPEIIEYLNIKYPNLHTGRGIMKSKVLDSAVSIYSDTYRSLCKHARTGVREEYELTK